MHRPEPAQVTAELLDELRRITPFDLVELHEVV
jgi:hypothetical protein